MNVLRLEEQFAKPPSKNADHDVPAATIGQVPD
jgi:hypothetical protein